MKNQLLSFLLTIGLITLNGCSNLDEGNYEFAYENALEYYFKSLKLKKEAGDKRSRRLIAYI